MSHNIQIHIRQLDFILSNGKLIFNQLNLVFGKQKTGIVGKNGIGKSTLLRLIIGELYPSAGCIHSEQSIAYVPQSEDFLAFNKMTIASLLGFENKIQSLQRILQGSTESQYFECLNEDWHVEERLQQQLMLFGLQDLPYDFPVKQLSGGEITRLLLTKAFFSDADFLLLDEPTNHLDSLARKQLYQAIARWGGGILVVSHDRTLLNHMEKIVELNTLGVACYGGNYDYYVEQKLIEKTAREQSFQDAKKLLEKTQKTIQASREKHEKKQSYGRALRKSGCIDKMAANSKKGRSERTQKTLLIKQERLDLQAETKLQVSKEKMEINDEIHVELPKTYVPNGKLILAIEQLTFAYPLASKPMIKNFNLQLFGSKRIALVGENGSGKTTLVNLILGYLKPSLGTLYLGTKYICYLDQHASLLNPELSLLENFIYLNPAVKEYDAYRSLAAFLFKNITVHKQVKYLSGGEKLRAMLACILMTKRPPQLLILDEPTNHLDLSSILRIESALRNYQGAMIIISHDQEFLKNVGVEDFFNAPFID
jgi:ATPase subunit of ABC transporter with duplicated ATPase domains